MARLPYVDPAPAPEPVRELLERLPVKLNVFRMMAHAESDFRPLVGLSTAILGRQKLSAKLRELAILRVAALSPARYEWVQHVPIAQAMGATPPQVAALERGDIAADVFDSLERVRSEEHTSELQSLAYLVCRLLLEKKNHEIARA